MKTRNRLVPFQLAGPGSVLSFDALECLEEEYCMNGERLTDNDRRALERERRLEQELSCDELVELAQRNG